MDHMIRVTAEVTLENEEEVRALITRAHSRRLRTNGWILMRSSM